MTTHGGPRPNAGRKPNTIPSQRIVIHATDDELRAILELTPRERTERLLEEYYNIEALAYADWQATT